MYKDFGVKIWEEIVEIPTYCVGEPDKNPMFLEKRVYQGSSGKVYPLPCTDKISDEKVNKKYNMVYLENKYLKIDILPEIGGRIQRAYDKTNDYDFVYYNKVIKPALVGLAGPWISGGIEFNWPQHHRPSTFSPVEYSLEENTDGSKTVFVSEIDRMYGTKATVGFTLYPDKAYLEIKAQLYNGTEVPQTFLWWANPAVAVSDYTKSIFPPDVHAVFDHGKRDVSKFPIATGEYYKMDYSSGVDISRYKNIPVPTSYMAYHSDYNFVGGYDFSKEAGILHVADHHVSPGKKQWTWGCGDFGQAWDRNLTDEDGPYIELMTGVFTDNQPDFTWLQPYEMKKFTQYFMPYKAVGEVKNASIDAAINIDIAGDTATIYVYTTSEMEGLYVKLKKFEEEIFNEKINISPEKAYVKEVKIDENIDSSEYELELIDSNGKMLLSYKEDKKELLKTPEAAKPVKEPEDCKNNEELFLTGLHIEQYRHATYEPDPYYLEGLKRDLNDIRINNAYGVLLYRRGLLEDSEKHFRRAIKSITRRNPNPYDGEPYYNLGLTLKLQGRLEEAYDAFYKSVWNNAWQHSGYYSLAQISCEKGEFNEALEHAENSIIRNYHSTKVRNLKTSLLRKMGRLQEAENFAYETIKIDKLDFASRNELYYLYKANGENEKVKSVKKELIRILRNSNHNYLELSLQYASAGLYDEAIDVLQLYCDITEKDIYPMVYYYMAYFYDKKSNKEKALKYFKIAQNANPDYCFPNRLYSMIVLEKAIEMNPDDAKARYYLGNLLYDKKQHLKAIELWEESVELDSTFPTVIRNLALAQFNKFNKRDSARELLEKAYNLNKNDARVLFELDQLYKKIGMEHSKRLDFLKENINVVGQRDDLYIEYITLYNNLGQHETGLKLLMERKFHPWEGGEGKVISQYLLSLISLAKKAISENKLEEAIEYLERAKVYPHNLGEGKLAGVQENNIDYYLGCAYEELKEKSKAKEYFFKASVGLEEPTDMMYYNDQPADSIFYQGLALEKLGRETEARGRFNKLYDYGEKHIFDKVKIDYFAVSLPDFLVFNEDLNRKNKVHCKYLMGLGCLGLGNIEKAEKELKAARKLDLNHQGILVHLNLL
ncbi:DUF5107 domain-containing protein [Clostridium sediminicola]|uniref:DUF5107 domain-containing protein n=1 Tax=Clostridium sediminicola TaxID=3114879 RepID=UPI0031F27801